MFTLLSGFSIGLLVIGGIIILFVILAVVKSTIKVVDQVSDIKQVPLDSIKDFGEARKKIDPVTISPEQISDGEALYKAMHDPIASTKSSEGVYGVHMKPLVPDQMTKPTVTKSKPTVVQPKYSGPKYSKIGTKEVAEFMKLNQVSGTPAKLTESELNAILKDIASSYRSAKESPYIFYTKESVTNIAQAIGFKTYSILTEYLKGGKVSKNNKDLIELYFKNNVKNYMLAPTGISKSDNASEKK